MSRGAALSPEEEFDHLLRAHDLVGFAREHKFHPKRRWRFDFAHQDARVAVEIEGGTWGFKDPKTGQKKVGRHATGKGYAADLEKYNAAAELGWIVLRYTPEMCRTLFAIQQVRAVVNGRLLSE